MSNNLHDDLAKTKDTILALEHEREAIYADGHIEGDEHPRLTAIVPELETLWDHRRRLEAAIDAGLNTMPNPKPMVR